MSWFQSEKIANLAKNALKEAQKTIDKALDIRDEETSPSSSATATATDFFASWGAAVANHTGVAGTPLAKSPVKTKNIISTEPVPVLDHDVPPPPEMEEIVPGMESISLDADPIYCDDLPISFKSNPATASSTSGTSGELIPPLLPAKASTASSSSASSNSLSLSQQESADEVKFHSLWLLTDSDSFESSIEAGQTSNSNSTSSAKAEQQSLADEDSATLTAHSQPSLCSNSSSRQSLLLVQDEEGGGGSDGASDSEGVKGRNEPEPQSSSTPTSRKLSADFPRSSSSDAHTQEKRRSLQGTLSPNVLTRMTMVEDDEDGLMTPYDNRRSSGSENRLATTSSGDLEDDANAPAHVHEDNTKAPPPQLPVPDLDSDERFEAAASTSKPPLEPVNVGTDHSSFNAPLALASPPESDGSSKSASSRATSSISVISEEKESGCQSASGPSSPSNERRTSPSFEMISIPGAGRKQLLEHCLTGHSHSHLPQPLLPLPGNGSGSGGYVDLQPMSMSIVHSHTHSQSVSVASTPQSHSRSNSNTSSSFDRIEDHGNRSRSDGGRGHPHFVSSTSSSDIEVIPLDSMDGGTSRRVVVSLAEAETQTEAEVAIEAAVPQGMAAKMAQILKEKDMEIAQLREEGEKLSKKQFDLSTIIKKLRVKEKETEGVVKGLRLEMATGKCEIERLMKSFVQKEGVEQSQSETIGRLNGEKRKLECSVDQLRSDLEDAQENAASMKGSLEEASIEILELQNSLAGVQRDTAELNILTKEKSELITQNESLQKELDHLRSLINSNQSSNSTRESELRNQVTSLTAKVHGLESQLADVASDIADATSPLSLEIEKLQVELKAKESRSERKESSLQLKIHDLESKLRAAAEHEKSGREARNSSQEVIARLELDIESLTLERDTLTSQLEAELDDKALTVEKLARILQLEREHKEAMTKLNNATNEITSLEKELKTEKLNLEAERRKSQGLMDQLMNNSRGQQQGHVGKGPSGENSPSASIISEASYLEEVFDPNGSGTHSHHNNNPNLTPKFFENFGSTINLYDSIQAQLRQREMEVLQFQGEVAKNEKMRKTLNEEIAHLTVQNQELLMQMERLEEVQRSLAEVQKNYNAVLQMYGEKVEEADELRMDLQDVKEMYKLQIEQLLKKS